MTISVSKRIHFGPLKDFALSYDNLLSAILWKTNVQLNFVSPRLVLGSSLLKQIFIYKEVGLLPILDLLYS